MKRSLRATAHCVSVIVLVAAFGCASSPLETEEAVIVREMPPLPVCLDLVVACDSDAEIYGPTEEWAGDFRRLFVPLRVCEAILDPDERDGPVAPDRTVRVRIQLASPAAPRVDRQGALLDVLAWITVPLLPLWIGDVHVDPGLTVEVDTKPFPVEPVLTNLLERYPFFSLPVAGAVLVPPFVFKEGRKEHLAATVSRDVRTHVALQIARFLKDRSNAGEELIPRVASRVKNGKLYIAFERGSALKDVRFSVERGGGSQEQIARLLFGDDETLFLVGAPEHRRRSRDLKVESNAVRIGLPRRHWADALRVRIVATGLDGEQSRYTVSIPEESSIEGAP